VQISRVAVRQVRKVFGRHPALAGVSFELAPGGISLLMGPNGAGKSTLLGILSTLSPPTSGEVRYGEHDHPTAHRLLRGRIGLLAHDAMLYDRMSCRENLVFFARLYGLSRPAEVASRWLERVQMQEAADRQVSQLSRGMLQRVALARVLLPDPELLLLDEPFTGLDRDAVALLRQQLKQVREAGTIILLVTHDVEAVDGLCDHLLVLRRGHLAAEHRESGLAGRQIQERYHAAL